MPGSPCLAPLLPQAGAAWRPTTAASAAGSCCGTAGALCRAGAAQPLRVGQGGAGWLSDGSGCLAELPPSSPPPPGDGRPGSRAPPQLRYAALSNKLTCMTHAANLKVTSTRPPARTQAPNSPSRPLGMTAHAPIFLSRRPALPSAWRWSTASTCTCGPRASAATSSSTTTSWSASSRTPIGRGGVRAGGRREAPLQLTAYRRGTVAFL